MFVRSILIAKRQMAFSMAYEWNWITTQAKMDIHPAKKCPSWWRWLQRTMRLASSYPRQSWRIVLDPKLGDRAVNGVSDLAEERIPNSPDIQ